MRRPWWPFILALALLAWGVAPGTAAARAWEPSQPFLSPVDPLRVAALARIPVHDWLPGHRGVDLDAPSGRDVVAPAPGTVTFAGTVVDRPVLTITHDDGARSSVEPVLASVAVGERVVAGQVIGEVDGSPGHCAPEACVHWGVRVGERYVDPLDVLTGFGPVRLLPRDRAAFAE